jgi:hypothetical protein
MKQDMMMMMQEEEEEEESTQSEIKRYYELNDINETSTPNNHTLCFITCIINRYNGIS